MANISGLDKVAIATRQSWKPRNGSYLWLGKCSAESTVREERRGEHSGESTVGRAQWGERRAEGVAQRAQLIMQRARRIRLGGRDRESMADPTKRALLAAGLVDWRKFGQYVTRKLSLLC